MPLEKRAMISWFIQMDIRGIAYCHDRVWGRCKESVEVDIPDDFMNKAKEKLKQIFDE